MVDVTTADGDSMARIATPRRELSSEETQQARHHARQAIHDDSDVVDWSARAFEVSPSLVKMSLAHVEFAHASETGGTWLLEAHKPIHRRDDADGLLTITIDYLPQTETVETIRVAATT